jgi:general secretion pathway protein M
MRQWWAQLTARERLVLGVAAIVAVLLLAWALLLEPLSTRQAALQARIAAQERTLRQLDEAADLLRDGTGPAARQADFGGRSMASVVEQGLRMAGLAGSIRRIEPAQDGSVSVVLEQAPFDPLVGWLEETSATTGIRVVELGLERAENAGRVNARMRLAAPS